MADEQKALTEKTTDPLTPGQRTSEGKLAIANYVVGFFSMAASVYSMLETLNEAMPGTRWVAMAMGIIGAILMLGTALGYTKWRTVLKVEQVKQAGAAAEAAAGAVRTQAQAADVLRGPGTPP